MALLALAVGASLALVSCGAGTRVVARVGDQVITDHDLLEVGQDTGQYPWSPDSAKHLVLDDLIRRKLMLAEAARRGLSRDTVLRATRHTAEEELLTRALTDRIAPHLVPVSADEIEEFYGWRRIERHVQVLLATNEATIRRALARIRAGESFSIVADQLNPPGTVPPGGDIGFVPGGAMLEPLDSSLRHAHPGELLGPLHSGDTWFLARVLEQRTRDLPPIAPQVDDVRAQLRQRKQRAIIQGALDALRASYAIQLEPGAGPELFVRMNLQEGAVPDTTRDTRPLAHYLVGADTVRYTLAEALRDLRAGTDAPNAGQVPALERWIETQIVRRVVVAEARRWRLNEEPEIARRIDERVNNEVLQSLYQTEVLDQVQVTDDELRLEYARRLQGPNHPPFEQMPAQIREQLRSIVLENAREARLRAFTDGLRGRFPVTIDEAALLRVRWPVVRPLAPQAG